MVRVRWSTKTAVLQKIFRAVSEAQKDVRNAFICWGLSPCLSGEAANETSLAVPNEVT